MGSVVAAVLALAVVLNVLSAAAGGPAVAINLLSAIASKLNLSALPCTRGDEIRSELKKELVAYYAASQGDHANEGGSADAGGKHKVEIHELEVNLTSPQYGLTQLQEPLTKTFVPTNLTELVPPSKEIQQYLGLQINDTNSDRVGGESTAAAAAGIQKISVITAENTKGDVELPSTSNPRSVASGDTKQQPLALPLTVVDSKTSVHTVDMAGSESVINVAGVEQRGESAIDTGGGSKARQLPVTASRLQAETMPAATVVVPTGKTTTSSTPTNLGRVSISCEMSAYRMRCFLFCNAGSTYGDSPTLQQAHHPSPPAQVVQSTTTSSVNPVDHSAGAGLSSDFISDHLAPPNTGFSHKIVHTTLHQYRVLRA